MKFLEKFFGKKEYVEYEAEEELFREVKLTYPNGPAKRGLFKKELTDGSIAEILIYEEPDHWFFLFVSDERLSKLFEISIRVKKIPEDPSPPEWPIEPVTRVANGIAEGLEFGAGTTWIIGQALFPFAGFMIIPDIRFGNLTEQPLPQLVLITGEELKLKGDPKEKFLNDILTDKKRMIATI